MSTKFPKTLKKHINTRVDIIISSENVKDYFLVLVKRYDLYLNLCPFCGHRHLIRWGYYKRWFLPLSGFIRIQRIRCTNCGHTTNVLPSFLLAHKSHQVSVLKELVTTFINNPDDWHKSPEIIIDISTAYRWLRLLAKQAMECLPVLRKALLNLKPEHPVIDTTDAQPVRKTDTQIIFKRFLSLSDQLFKAAVCLVDKNNPKNEDLFCFLNYFLTKETGKALLVN